jgi:hypothetical protein
MIFSSLCNLTIAHQQDYPTANSVGTPAHNVGSYELPKRKIKLENARQCWLLSNGMLIAMQEYSVRRSSGEKKN